MNEKINLMDLSALLAEKAAITKKEAETFFRAYFEIMNEELINSGLLKIKDLGAFKLSLMEDRESIDVTTGERVLIPAHYKVIFTPDKKLAEIINEPFAIFETVEIGEEFKPEEFKMLPGEDALNESNALEDEEEMIIEMEKESTVEEEEEEINMEKESTVEEEEVNSLNVEPVPLKKKRPRYWNKESFCLNCHDYEAHRVYKKKYYKQLKKTDRLRKIIYILSILLAITLGYIVFLFQFEIRSPFKKDSNKIGATNSISDKHTNTDVSEALTDSITLIDEQKEKEINDQSPLLETPEEPKQITVVSGQRLTSIAENEYGDKVFWIYIYLENKAILSNPNILPVGVKITLPPAGKYGIDNNDPSSIQKAKEMAKNP